MIQLKYSLIISTASFALITSLTGCATFNRDNAVATLVESPGSGASEIRQVSFEESQVKQAEIDPVELENESWWDLLNPTKVSELALESAGQHGTDQDKAKQLFREAEALYDQSKQATGSRKESLLTQAATRFERAAKYYPDSDLEENCLMYTGECFYFTDNYTKASDAYNQLIVKYPNTKHLDTVGIRRFKLAQFWISEYAKDPSWSLTPNLTDDKFPLFDRYGHAIKQFDLIRLDDPTGKLADDATLAAASAHFKNERYADADRFFTDLRDNFPTSEHQFAAHFLGLYCKLRIYQGPAYDGGSLNEADKLAKRIERQFPDEAQKNREVLEKAKKEIRGKLAERRWHLATFFDNRKDYGGAKYYYGLIIKEFPNSNMAEAAAKRIDEIADRPNVNPPKAKWLVDLISTQDNDMPKISRQPENGGSSQLR